MVVQVWGVGGEGGGRHVGGKPGERVLVAREQCYLG